MASFSMPGVGSGLPFDDWLAKLQVGENTRLNPYLQKQEKYNSQVSSWGKISSALDTLKGTMTKLDDEGFNGVSVSDNKTFKATAEKGAQADSYSIAVRQLAKAHKIGSALQKDSETKIGNSAATVNIDVGDGKTMKVDLKADETSLKYVAQKINAQNGDVTASVVAAEGGQSQLVITSKKTGEANQISVEVTGNSQLASALNYDPNQPDPNDPTKASLIAAAKDAIVEIDGRTITDSSNSLKDKIGGITLELREVSEKDPDSSDPDALKTETLTVTADTSKVKSLIEEFVNVYNNFLKVSAEASKYTEPDKNASEDAELINSSNGALFGDGTLRRITSSLKSTVTGMQGNGDDLFATLGALGIEVKFDSSNTSSGSSSTLTIDKKKLDAALKDHPKEVEELFLGKNDRSGMKNKLDEMLKLHLGDSDITPRTKGSIADSIEGLKQQETRVSAQIKRMEMQTEKFMERKRAEFIRLDKAISDMNSSQSSLTASLAGMI